MFVNEGFTTHVNELSAPESRALLAFLFAHVSKPEFVVRWKWRLGDVAFWDNRLTQHYATDDYRPARRVMKPRHHHRRSSVLIVDGRSGNPPA